MLRLQILLCEVHLHYDKLILLENGGVSLLHPDDARLQIRYI
jgi:hypothetical protein